jgi:hypothetical protein
MGRSPPQFFPEIAGFESRAFDEISGGCDRNMAFGVIIRRE